MDMLNIQEKTNSEKVLDFLKENIINFIITLICFIYVFKDILEIKESGKTVLEIVADGTLSLFMGYTLDILFTKKGAIAGTMTQRYISAMKRYGDEIENTNSNIDKLDDFCNRENEEMLIKAQTNILRRARIKYTDFENETMQDVCKFDKNKIKYWKKAETVKIHLLNSDNLLSDVSDKYEKGAKNITKANHDKATAISKLLTKGIVALISGYFAVTIVTENMANLLWGALQICLYLVMAIISYFQEIAYLNDVYINEIYRKTKTLIKFNTTIGKGGTNNG